MSSKTFFIDPNQHKEQVLNIVQQLYVHQQSCGYFPLSSNGLELWWDAIYSTLGHYSQIVAIGSQDLVKGISVCRLKSYPKYLQAPPRALISEFFISPDQRSQGLGTMLYKASQAWFTSKGLQQIEINIVANNLSADHFWQKMGFKNELSQWSASL